MYFNVPPSASIYSSSTIFSEIGSFYCTNINLFLSPFIESANTPLYTPLIACNGNAS